MSVPGYRSRKLSNGAGTALLEAGRRASDQQTLQIPTRTRAFGSSHIVINKVREQPHSGKAWTISIRVNTHPANQAGLIHAGPWK